MTDLIDSSLDVELNNVGLLASFLEENTDGFADDKYVVPLVAGKFVFEVKEAKAVMTEITDWQTKEKVARPQVQFALEITEVTAIAPGQKDVPSDTSELVGKRLTDRITWTGAEDDKSRADFLGFIRTFCKDAMGRPFSGSYNDLLQEVVGARFNGEVTMRKGRKDDPNNYPQLKRGTKGAITAAL